MLTQSQLRFFRKKFKIDKSKAEELFNELYFDAKFLTKNDYREFFKILCSDHIYQDHPAIRNFFSERYSEDFYYKVKILLTDFSLLKLWDVVGKINSGYTDNDYFDQINKSKSPYELPASYNDVLSNVEKITRTIFFNYCNNNRKKYEDVIIEIIKEVGYSYLLCAEFHLITAANITNIDFLNEVNKELNNFHTSLSKNRDKRKWLTFFLISDLKHLGFGTTTIYKLISKILQYKTGNTYTEGGVERNYYRFVDDFKKSKLTKEDLIQKHNLENELHDLTRMAIRLNTDPKLGIIEKR